MKANRIRILDADEAARVEARVITLRSEWTRVGERGSAFALGTASYWAGDDYEERAARTNPRLRDAFGWLYERLVASLVPALRASRDSEVVFERRFGVPGFQILVVDDVAQDPRGLLGGAHWDWNFLNLDWEPALGDELELDGFASFTLPIVLPRAGSGLCVWETLTSAQVATYAQERELRQWDAIAELTRESAPPTFFPYAVGELVVHSGHLVHQVPPWTRAAGDVRITLQGHALHHDGRWRIYW
jgi:hypothetical protein